MEIKPIAYIHTDLPTKFGLPRQSGLVEGLTGEIVLEPEYRQAEALRGLEDFTHIWLIWDFSHAHTGRWSATVRPPRLGGNTRMGVVVCATSAHRLRRAVRPGADRGWHRHDGRHAHI